MRVRCPAVLHSIVVVVWVGVGIMLVAMHTQIISVEVVLRLKSLRERSLGLHFPKRLKKEVWNEQSKEAENRELSVLLCDHPFPEVLFHVDHPRLGGPWLSGW